jgi:hypothetical protein
MPWEWGSFGVLAISGVIFTCKSFYRGLACFAARQSAGHWGSIVLAQPCLVACMLLGWAVLSEGCFFAVQSIEK